ncbi:asparagine synthase-related protein [Lentzea sp. BCCO 10_0856]|uniref:Asparagine synthase-related protein n=1 Tax=Lentzea miocenica TaxID=3095431 RepID=A0ABU4SZ76_9PSEU|nr:asparagine synthase-related protein [Lentzea sp. BCCO 10_0856]MDX8031214.1 asparagine synthase-related protein [Lentzea sp. BCCO 10_0856]
MDFQLDRSTSDLRWRKGDGRWVCGRSWIKPFKHPLVEQFCVANGRSTLLVTRERQTSVLSAPVPDDVTCVDAPTYEKYLSEMREWPLEYLVVEHHHEDGAFSIRAGQWGSAPVYLVEATQRLRGTWSLPALRPYIRADQLNALEVVRGLTYRLRYSRETYLEGVFQLTERAEAEYTKDRGLQLRYPEPAKHALPRDVRDDVDLVGVFEQELDRAVTAWPFAPGETAVELSGGMDSANVAMTLAALGHRDVQAYALIFGGDIGEQQLRRRREMIEHCGFADMRIDALDHPPLKPFGARASGEPLHPLAQPYHEGLEHVLDLARSRGVRTVFTGDGGDQLFSLREAEWSALGSSPGRNNPHRPLPTWLGERAVEQLEYLDSNLPPATVLNPSALLGFASRTPQYLEAGMWQVSPLCSPRLAGFCEQLPLGWRKHKRLARERLRRLGFSDDVVNPALRENFTHVMEYALAEFGMPLLEKQLDHSILVDLGYVDADELRAIHGRIANGGEMDLSIFAFLRMELGVRGVAA